MPVQSTQPLMSSFGAFPGEQVMHPVAPSPSAFVTSGAWHGSHDGAPLPANLPTGHNAHSVCFKGTSLARLARYAKKPLVVLEGLAGPYCACRACLTSRYEVAGIGGVASACVAPARGRIVKEPIVTRIVPQVLIVLGIRNEDIVDAVAIEVARRATE